MWGGDVITTVQKVPERFGAFAVIRYILPQRNPLILAKEIATLDHLTNGKVELGIGVGWLKEEFEVADRTRR